MTCMYKPKLEDVVKFRVSEENYSLLRELKGKHNLVKCKNVKYIFIY